MTSIMNRSFAEHIGVVWPKHIAQIVDGKPVTFAELLDRKRERQGERLTRKLFDWNGEETRAAYLWTFYQPGLFGFVYMGWWAYIRTLNDSYQISVRDIGCDFALSVMAQFPCGVIPIRENFRQWAEAFGGTYARPGRFKQQGLVLGWIHLKRGYPERFRPLNRLRKSWGCALARDGRWISR